MNRELKVVSNPGIFTVKIEAVDEIPAGVAKIDIPLVNLMLLLTVSLFGFDVFQVGLI